MYCKRERVSVERFVEADGRKLGAAGRTRTDNGEIPADFKLPANKGQTEKIILKVERNLDGEFLVIQEVLGRYRMAAYLKTNL